MSRNSERASMPGYRDPWAFFGSDADNVIEFPALAELGLGTLSVVELSW